MRLFFYLFLLLFIRGIAFPLDLQKEGSIEYDLNSTEYKIHDFFWYTFAYDFENSNLIAQLFSPNNSRSGNYKLVDKSKKTTLSVLKVLGNDGTIIGDFTTSNSYSEGSVVAPSFVRYRNKKIEVYDTDLRRHNIYSYRNNKYNIVKVIDLGDYASGYSTYLHNGMVYNSYNYIFLRDSSLSAQVCEIEKDKYSEISYDTKNPTGLMSYLPYREFTGYILKNKDYKEKESLKKMYKDVETILEMETTIAMYAIDSFIFGEDFYYGINLFGTEIVEHNYNNKVVNRYSIDPIKKLREMEFPITGKDLKELKSKFEKRDSRVHQAFFDSDENNILLIFEAGKLLQNKGVAKHKLFIFSLDKKKVIGEISIEFTPIGYDSNSNTLAGLKYINEKEFILEKYHLTF
ncbi:MAG: hypothetical protein CR982_10405 [Candidatus Cloacimonadota bacterium]|nr:MAG: hypothetical protein CR982_10405 [Candidatus Cloacimonadota bacterium]PIE79712.1 MAG: hypothetical protein CSA15_02745 [Candidatus Delongbacteria bacterium]